MNTQTLLDNVATINKDNGIFVNAKEFLKELRQVATAVAKPSDHRPNLTFVHVRITENNLILEATDSHVLERANVAASIPSELVGKEFLIDGKFAKNLSKSPTKHGNQLGVYPQFNDGKYKGIISIVGGGEEFIDDSRENISVFGYPDLVRVTPYLNDATVKFDVQQKEIFPVLKEIVKKSEVVALLVKDNVVKLKYSNWEQDLEFPIAVTNIEVEGEFKINFNVKKLKQRLQHLSSRENLTFRFYQNAYRPFTISRENGGLVWFALFVCTKRKFGDDFRVRFLIDTGDGFRERVNEQELIKWGESFGIGLEMTLTEAIEALENIGYKVEKLEEKRKFGGNVKMLVLEDFEPLTIEEFQDLKLNAPTFQAGEIDVCRKFYDYNKDILVEPIFVRNSDYCMIVSKNEPEDENLTYID